MAENARRFLVQMTWKVKTDFYNADVIHITCANDRGAAFSTCIKGFECFSVNKEAPRKL